MCQFPYRYFSLKYQLIWWFLSVYPSHLTAEAQNYGHLSRKKDSYCATANATLLACKHFGRLRGLERQNMFTFLCENDQQSNINNCSDRMK